jgi:hypothetical protein
MSSETFVLAPVPLHFFWLIFIYGLFGDAISNWGYAAWIECKTKTRMRRNLEASGVALFNVLLRCLAARSEETMNISIIIAGIVSRVRKGQLLDIN